MGDKLETTNPKVPSKNSSKLTRRRFGQIALGVAGAAALDAVIAPNALASNDPSPITKSPSETPPVINPQLDLSKKNKTPESEKPIPQEFSKPILDMAEAGHHFLNNEEGIQVQISKGQYTSVNTTYHPSGPENFTPVAPQLFIHFSEKSDKPWGFTHLEVGWIVAEIIRKNKGDYIRDKFTDALSGYTNLDFKNINKGAFFQDTEHLVAIQDFFDFTSFTDGIKRELPIRDKKVSEDIFDKALALIFMKPHELAKKIENAQSSPGEYANITGQILNLILDAVPVGTNWNNLGLDEKSIGSILNSTSDQFLKSKVTAKIQDIKSS